MTNCYRLLRFFVLFVCSAVTTASGQIAALPPTLELRVIDGITVPYQNGLPLPTFEKQRRPTIDLKGLWLKQRFAANHILTMGKRDSAGYAAVAVEAAGRFLPSYNDAGWTAKNLPAVENALNGLDQRPEDYEDGVWYRRTFAVPESLKNYSARLNFLAVNYVADVWLNGRYLGYHEGGYASFSFDISAAVRTDTLNVLCVRVDNPPWGSRDDVIPYGTLSHKPDWFNFTGIVHDVYLEFAGKLAIIRAEAVPQTISGEVQVAVVLANNSGAGKNAQVTVEAHTANIHQGNIQSEVSADLLGPMVASQSGSVSVGIPDSVRALTYALSIPSPKLWSPKHPDLYILRVVVTVGVDTIDQYYTQFGIRTLGLKNNTVLLNGRPMFFPGVARHEDHYLYGRSVPVSLIYSDLQKVTDLNATFLRTAHYPNHPYTYLLADRLGIAVMEEIPLWWFDESNAWFKQDFFRHLHEQMWREMVFRDRNRPSILFWSTCNECLDVTNRGNFIARVNTELDTRYPDGRFVSESAAADRPGPTDPTQAACDVAGWTMYFGVFHGGTYYAGTKDFLQKALAAYPAKPIVDTEFGYWSKEDLGTASVQVAVFDSTFKAFNEFVSVDSTGTYRPGKPLSAVTWWCIFDWFTTQQGTGTNTLGAYKIDHETVKPVAARIRNVYRPFKASSENAVLGVAGAVAAEPSQYSLAQNYPNPFNPKTVIGYQVPGGGGEGSGAGSQGAVVRLAVYDILGREVAVLVNEPKESGEHRVEFVPAGLGTGVYFYRLKADNYSTTRKMVLVK